MYKKINKIYSLVACLISFVAISITLWAYFVMQRANLNQVIIIGLCFGFILVYEFYNFSRNDSYFASFFLERKKNFGMLITIVGCLIFSGLSFYFGLIDNHDVSQFNRIIFVIGGIFFLLLPLSTLWMNIAGRKKYESLSQEKKEEAESRLLHLSKVEPQYIVIAVVVLLLVYLFLRG